MPNAIKYNTNPETLALRKGDFYIGTGDVGKGPTSSTGYYNGITPPPGGYTIYVNKASGGPSIKVASNESELIAMTNEVGGTSFTTSGECLNYFATQTDKMCLNRDYEPIITSGLTYSFDFGFSIGYPKSGSTFYDLIGTNNGTLFNEPTYSPLLGDVLVFDGSNDYGIIPNSSAFNFGSGPFTIEVWSDIAIVGAVNAVIEKNNGAFGPGGFQLQNLNGRYTWRIGNNSGTIFYQNPDNYAGGWVYNVLTSEGLPSANYLVYWSQYDSNINQHTLYSGGTSFPNDFDYVDNDGDINVARRGSGSFYMNGYLGLFRTYNRTLSSSEIESNFNAQKSRFTQ